MTAPTAESPATCQEYHLANGLHVVLAEDHLSPVAAVCVWYHVGSRDERPGRTGLAHLFEHLMFQGSAQVPGNGHFEAVQAGGGTANGTTSFERTNYFETVPVQQLELTLWLEADRMGGLLESLTQQALDNQRDVVKNERRQRYDNVPYGTVWERLMAMLHPAGHPYHHMPIGSMTDLDAATMDDARTFFRTHYAPSNAVLAVVGAIDPQQTRAWIDRYFGSLPGEPAARPPVPSPLPAHTRTEQRAVVREPVPADALMCAYRMPPDGTREADAADLALSVLGAGESSRLATRLTRDDQIAMNVSMGLMRFAHAPSLGWLDIKAAGGADIRALERTLDEELARFAAEGPTPAELDRARAHLERRHLDATSTVGGRADLLCRHATFFGSARTADRALAALHDITAAEVRAVGAAHLQRDNRSLLVYERPATPPGRTAPR
ncbi:insulinase family protein [Streptomyces sp. NBC_00536]|uniref:M16 family metallopeptidase n=1 Tax=Streptomyces sp. NBC_00536 TaxID=2975769 RepID=UPI002E808DAF|nr:pitrilysin family protein [Streptomyces sp. NBC_00536]WUC82542.1 insulinase family protein [Streptomyces sp. NBC_00536]